MRDGPTDPESPHRAIGVDRAPWEAIYEETCDRLFSLLLYQIGDREEALDLLQETYLQAFRRLDSYRGDAPFEAWLRAIAIRKAIDWKRTVLRRLKRTDPFDERTPVSPTRPPEPSSSRARLHRSLQRLTGHQRAVLLLREWDGWSFREIAGSLGCKESTVRVHHARARARMRRFLNGGGDPESRGDREGRPR
ncbi:MAG: sigma-70 family RNA polymerase sigma factor [Candidatus Eisenbacteria bacterium]|nr:sigma-70 family RNA polymerase sigma factor [Candidatus Latescibacterota bacterium]MBD3302606.1 sigma-70 family RNA polymerase sigma factor [Candidatus Eisenbacteria bacterium]